MVKVVNEVVKLDGRVGRGVVVVVGRKQERRVDAAAAVAVARSLTLDRSQKARMSLAEEQKKKVYSSI
jgi:hypothetical protein